MIETLEELEKSEARRILDEALVPINWLGYKCIVSAVPIVIDAIKKDQKVKMEELYRQVAKKHRTTYKKVEYAIRYLCDNSRIAKSLNCSKINNSKLLLILPYNIMQKLNL